MSDTDLGAIVDELYALPLSQFTPVRDARARALKAAGSPLTARVKQLRKPSLAAWTVNLLVRREADQMTQLVTVGEALIAAQAGLDGDGLRQLTRQRRQVTAALTVLARRHAAASGHRVTEAVAHQVEDTLTAAMVDRGAAAAVLTGMLVRTLEPARLEPDQISAALAVPESAGSRPTPRPAGAPARALAVVPGPPADEQARWDAEERVARAECTLAEQVEADDEAAAEVARTAAALLQAQSEIEEHRRVIADLEDRVDDLDDQLAAGEEVRAGTAEGRRRAEAELRAARDALAELAR